MIPELKYPSLAEGIKGLNNIIDQVTAWSSPYKKEATFIKMQCDIVTCIYEGKTVRIHSRFIYANILEVGELFNIDIRYIQN